MYLIVACHFIQEPCGSPFCLPCGMGIYEPDKLLQLFTDRFKEKYGVECVSALHHNKRKTNYHIHLIFSERELLPEPIEKTATRNMFYDENGKRVRTKKEILDENGNIRKGEKKAYTDGYRIFTPFTFRVDKCLLNSPLVKMTE